MLEVDRTGEKWAGRFRALKMRKHQRPGLLPTDLTLTEEELRAREGGGGGGIPLCLAISFAV